MTQSEHQAREQWARALVALVRKVEGGYRVGSTRDPSTWYFVSKVDGQICCSCPDFEKHFQEGGPLQGRGPGWECKHVLAVKLAHKLGKVNGKPAAQADLEAQAIPSFEGSCDLEAARQLDAQALRPGSGQAQAQEGEAQTATATIDLSEGEEACGEAAPGFNLSGAGFELIEVEEPALSPVEGEAVLEPCLVCKAKTPVDEMIPVSAPSGVGLVCRTCYDGRKACAFCGTRLPIEQLITISASGRAGLACEGCYSKSRSCSHCGDNFLTEQMVAVREPGFFGYFCAGCAEEREDERAAGAEVEPVPTLQKRIARVNEVLASFGNVAIEKVKVKNRQGQVVKELFGYGLQYTLDAVNAALGPDAWRYKLLEWRTVAEDKGALVLVDLELFGGTRWHSHGPMFGTTGLADEGDSFKGAIGDALKKSFAYWGIGNLAYRGELRPAR